MSLAVAAPVMAQTSLPGQTAVIPAKPVAPPTMAPAKMMAPVNINTATEAQLDAIPQIGPKRAASIIKNRPYKTVDDLVTKKAIPNGIFQKIKSHLTV